MIEEKQASTGGLVRGWFKAGITSLCGLVSGAVLMSITPLVDRIIKPARPIANFAMQVQGLSVTFNNRSLGGSEGWWDFGDGSALEPFNPRQETVSHAYPRAGTYNVKLSVQNLVGEQNERVITVNADPGSAAKPTIENFLVTPITPGSVSPAVFHVKAQVKDADCCIWVLGEYRKLEITDDSTPNQERYVTLKHPGKHAIRLVAVRGKETIEQSQNVVVEVPGTQVLGHPIAALQLTYDAVQVERTTLTKNVPVPWTAGPRDSTCAFEITRMLDEGHKDYRIVSAQVANKPDPHVRNVRIEISPDHSKYILRGELVQTVHLVSLQRPQPPSWLASLSLGLEKRTQPKAVPMDEIPVALNVPGATSIPIPMLTNGWEMTRKHMQLTLRDGSQVLWSRDQMPTNQILQMKNGTWRVNAVEQGPNLVLHVDPISTRLAGN